MALNTPDLFFYLHQIPFTWETRTKKNTKNSKLNLFDFFVVLASFYAKDNTWVHDFSSMLLYIQDLPKTLSLGLMWNGKNPWVDDVWHHWVTLSLDFSAFSTRFSFGNEKKKQGFRGFVFVKQPGKRATIFEHRWNQWYFQQMFPWFSRDSKDFYHSDESWSCWRWEIATDFQPTEKSPQMVVKSKGNPRLF